MSAGRRSLRAADREAELELFGRLPDEAVREEIVQMFMPLAEYLARRFDGRGESHDDLIQVASLGLLNAIDRFDVTRNIRFSTYAGVTIVGELKRHFRDKGWAIRVPRRLQEVGLRVNAVLPVLSQELGRSPTIEELADRAEASTDEVLDAMEAVQAYSTTPLEAPIGDEGTSPIDVLGEEDPSLELLERWASVAPAVQGLSERERRVLHLRFFRGLTQSEIAEQIGVSQMHVSRILSQTLRRLREEAGEDGAIPEDGSRGSRPNRSGR
ncbi:MAG: SigB/SigF/SigG family RNA polymerase sigma factor [Actinobacteria bacterium]|nr:SigB/SigF/SigG family RNA polymerase sigma factor [Actinomycetota bacterium]